ncbi:MAG TPA: VWA domain-containing protein [Chitinivibrionales bacterium]
MRFGSPQFFWLLLGIPLLIGLFIFVYQRKRAALRRFASPALIERLAPQYTHSRQILKWVLFVLFYLFGVIALTRPQFGVKMEIVERKGVDIMVALDISKSMLAEDVTPSRLERAKFEIARFIDLLKGDRVGIIIFAGESFVQCPLTLDYGAAKMFLASVNTDWVQFQGTDIAGSIGKAVEGFKTKSNKSRVLIVLSDGEETEGDAVEAAKKASADNIKIYTVGLGSESGVPIPINKDKSNVVYKKDNEGNLVMTKLNPLMLEKIAIAGNGKYFQAGTSLDLVSIYGEIAKMEKNEFGTDRLNIYEEQYQVFLGIAVLLILLEFFISWGGKIKTEWTGRV